MESIGGRGGARKRGLAHRIYPQSRLDLDYSGFPFCKTGPSCSKEIPPKRLDPEYSERMEPRPSSVPKRKRRQDTGDLEHFTIAVSDILTEKLNRKRFKWKRE
ncbi:unnamed protein product [Nezara viridula]|uniref:Uncharacterized protein n=1 Tax=Nezara viridula TaxID=85310 RepID=A0A9P0EE93_NEZVI|nr:unnamed protein product [Nezara viridula]